MLNPRSIATTGKIDDLRLSCACFKPDFLIVTESWLKMSHDSSLFHIDGYNLFRCDRTRTIGGGVAIYSKCNFRILNVCDNNIFGVSESLLITFKHCNSYYVLVGIYVPPNLNAVLKKDVIDHLVEYLDRCVIDFNELRIIVGGDFNNCDTSYLQRSHDLVEKVFVQRVVILSSTSFL